jgi:hypothetical protein
VQEQFAEKFPETPVNDRNVVRRRIEEFREIGSVSGAERVGRQSKLNDKNLVDISDSAAESIKINAQVGARGRYRAYNSAISGPRNIETLPIQSTDLQKVLANKINRVQTCMDARSHHFQHSAQRLSKRTVDYNTKGNKCKP